MFSALFIVSLWVAIMAFLSRSKRLVPADYVPISFVSALAAAATLSALLIEINAATYVSEYGWLLVVVLFASALASPRGVKNVVTGLAEFFCFHNDNLSGDYPSLPRGRFSSRVRLFRQGLFILVMGVMIATAFFQANPTNWDSNVYNLGRIPAMILAKTITLPETGSIRQAIFPLGHDLLNFYDISLGNLRGLSLINVLEWLVIIGSLFGLSKLLVQNRSVKSDDLLQIAFLLVLSLFISSDLQVFQGLSTKNDLVVLMLFLATLHIVVRKIAGCLSLRRSEMVAVLMLFFVYSTHCKSYGFITIIPIAVAVFFGLFSVKSTESQRLGYSQSPLSNTNYFLLGGLIILSIFNIWIIFYHSYAMRTYYDFNSIELKAITSDFVNTEGSLYTRLTNMALNIIRFLVIMFAYPFSTYLKAHPLRPDDYLLGLGPINSLLGVNKGLAKGYNFSLMRRFNEDQAIFSYVVHLVIIVLIVAGFISFLRILINRRPLSYSFISLHTRQPVATILVISSIFALFALASILLYQNWIARFLGTIFVPLYPILAVELASITNKLRFARSLKYISILFISFSLFLIPILATVRFLSVAINMGLSETWHRTNWHQYQGRQFFEFTNSNRISLKQTQSLLKSFRTTNYSNLIVCYGEDYPSLVPLFNLLMNPSSKTANIRLGNERTCQRSTHPIADRDLNNKNDSNNDLPTYIHLP